VRTNRSASLFRGAVARALLGTLVGYLPGFLLPFAITTKIHVGPLTDAYAFALGIANFASALFVGVLQTNVLPILQQLKRVGRSAFVGRLWLIGRQATVASVLLYGALSIAAVVYIGGQSRWTLAQERLTAWSLLLLGVFVVASAINAMLSAGLNALDRFLSPAALQALRSIAPLIVLPFVSRDPTGLLIVAAAVSGGELLRTAILVWQTSNGTRVLSAVAERMARDPAELAFWPVAGPTAVALLIAAASPLIDRGVAASLPAGSVTLIDLGERVFQVPLTVISASLVLVAGTYWADLGRRDVATLRKHVRQTMIRGTLVTVAMAVLGLIVVAGTVLAAGPEFAGAPTRSLAAVIALLLAGLPGAFVISAGARFLTSTRSTYLLPGFAVCSFSTNLVFDILGARLMGVEGIALSSTVYRCVNAALYLIVIRRLLASNFHGLRPRPSLDY